MADGPPPVDESAINQQASGEVDSDIQGQIAPYLGDITTAQSGQAGALGELDKMFPQLQDAANQSAQRQEEFYGGALNFERGIFNSASDRLNQFRQQRAAEAQTAAQEIGGPVPMNEFTYAADVAGEQGKNAFAAQMLHSLGYATAGVGEVEAWAGKVFPLLRIEETNKTINYFQEQIKAAQKQIDSIKAGAPAAKRTRADQLRLQQQQYNLDKWKAQKDAALAARQQHSQDVQNQQNQESLDIQKANALGYYEKWVRGPDGKPHLIKIPTLASKTVRSENAARTAQTKLGKGQLALDQKKTNASIAAQHVNNQRYAAQVLDSITHPTSSVKTVTRTTKVYVGDAKHPPSKYDGVDPDGRYWILKDVKSAVSSNAGMSVHDPNKAYDYLLTHGVSRGDAIATIRSHYGLPPGWQPNHEYKFAPADLHQMDFSQLRDTAMSMGWKPDPKHPRDRAYLEGWITKQQGRK